MNENQNPYAAPKNEAAPIHTVAPATSADSITAVICLVLSIFTVHSGVFGGFNLGFAAACLLWLIVGGIYICSAKNKPTPTAMFAAASAAALSVTFALYDDPFSKFLIFIAVIVLSTVAAMLSSRQNRHSPGGYRFISDILHGVVALPIIRLPDMFTALFIKPKNEKSQKRKASSGIAVGILCALPALFVIVPILIHADAAFENLISTVFSGADRLILSTFIGAFGFIFIFSVLMSYRCGTAKQCSTSSKSKFKASTAAVNTFLSVIGAVYLLYLLSQLSYFTGGFSGTLPDSFTYSEYAVRGFSEMCVICVINLLIVFFTIHLSRRKKGKINRVTAFIELFYCLFSLFIISTDIAKMFMYIGCYGMTKRRVLTSVFMLCLACCFIFIALRLFIRRFPYFKAIMVTVTVIGLAVSFADIDTTIARYNVDSYLSGKTDKMDVDMLSSLSSAAVPQIARLLDAPDQQIRTDAANRLCRFADRYDIDLVLTESVAHKFGEYNLSRTRAENVIIQNREIIRQLANKYE